MTRKIANENNDKSFEEFTKYFNKKVKLIEFKEDDWVLLKEHNFLHKNRKLADTFSGPLGIIKSQKIGTALIRSKTANHSNLVNKNLLVKYSRTEDEKEKRNCKQDGKNSKEKEPENSDQANKNISKRIHKKLWSKDC